MAKTIKPFNMASTASLYTPRVTAVTILPNTWTQIVKADSRRWYLYVTPVFGATIPLCCSPVNLTGILSPSALPRNYLELKYLDAPASVTSEWFGFITPGSTVLVHEELFTG